MILSLHRASFEELFAPSHKASVIHGFIILFYFLSKMGVQVLSGSEDGHESR